MTALDKNSPIPLYYQLYSLILNQIKDGEYKPGDLLPTEITLVKEYSVSRATVRQAILDLSRNGYVVREKSKGTYVKDYSNNVGYAGRIKSFTAISSQGGTIALTSHVLEKKVVVPSKSVAEALRLQEGEETFYLKRVRYIRGVVNTFVEDWIPYKLCKGIENEHFTNASLYEILERKYGIIPHHATRTFDCGCASTEEQILKLEIKNNTPLLRCESWVYDANDQPLEYYIALIKGRYTVNI